MPSAGLSPRRAVQLAALLALLVFYAAQLTGALLPSVPVFIAASVAGLSLDLYLTHQQPGLLALLGKVRFDVTTRQLLRDMLIVIGLVRIPDVPPDIERPLTLLLLISYAAHFLCQAVAQLVRRSRTLPILTRNIDATGLHLTSAPPRLLARQPSRRLMRFSIPGTIGLMLSAGLADELWGVIGVGLTFALSLAGAVFLGTWLLPGKRHANERQALEWLDRWLSAYRPTVGMYFSGGTTSAYQANMWLSTLAQLDGRPIIVLRERFMVQKIDATDIPILCIPKVAHLMHLEHSTLKMLLHPANSGKTSQVLRIPTIKHAFINHGESDKLSSCNPYAKAYDEIWVAGPAARERYQLADIGVDDRDIAEVGRPQLSPIQPYTGPPRGAYTTVLYAPTWEGWTDDPGNTSVILAGENVVAALLADPGVRLLYKPHPMTGSVDPRAREANSRIQAMIREANAQRSSAGATAASGSGADAGVGAGSGSGAGSAYGGDADAAAAAELERCTVELTRLTTSGFRKGADEVEKMHFQSSPDSHRAEQVAAATTAWENAYWASLPEWQHQIITGPRPAIYSCFNQADLLISDVSSVVSDYLTSEKPYAVANTSGLSESEFRAGFPTVRAAAILSPEAAEVPALLESVRDPDRDTLAEARAELKVHLLGPSDPPSMARFNQAVLDLCERADARNARVARRTDEIPGQRETREAEAREAAEEVELEPAAGGAGADPEDADQVTA